MTLWLVDWPAAYSSGSAWCGGKGWNLARLRHCGFSVPSGGVLTSALYRQVMACPGTEALSKKVRAIPADDLLSDTAADALNALRNAILAASLPDDFKSSLGEFLARYDLRQRPAAVRSSATLEDGATASFAGIHESFLNVQGQTGIEHAILACYASLWSARAISYRRRMGIADSDIAMAVVITRMVNAEAAGVAFSCNPVSGVLDEIVINANFGFGESVVSGGVEPDHCRVDRFHNTVIDTEIGRKHKMTVAREGGGTVLVDTPDPYRQCLTEAQLQKLARLCDRVFHALGNGEQHQDIEWVFDGASFILTQARPVTAIPRVTCPELVDQKEIWSNGNFRDAVPMVQSRLCAGIIEHYINHILRVNFDGFGYALKPGLRFGRQFQGRFYCNVSLMQWLYFDAVGFAPEKTNQSLGGHQHLIHIDAANSSRVRNKFLRLWRSLRFMKALNHYKKNAQTVVAEATAFAEHYRKIDFGVQSDVELIATFNILCDRLEKFDRPFIMLTAASGAIVALIQVLEKYTGERAMGLANALLAGRANLTSADHGYRLIELAQLARSDAAAMRFLEGDDSPETWDTALPEASPFRCAFQSYLDHYGHRAVYEMDLSNPRWREDPGYLLDCIKHNLASASVATLKATQIQTAEHAWQTVSEEIPWHTRPVIKKMVKDAAQGAASKELAKSTYVRFFEPIRWVILEMGNRLALRGCIAARDDIFHCAMAEIAAVLNGEWDGAALKELVAERKTLKAEQERLSPPDVIIDDQPQQAAIPSRTKGHALTGIGVAAGIATGRTRLITSPLEGQRLKSGDVLVAPSTDPAWTPLFLNAAAIVMETGGHLSHGAIVAREYGIPAVVNIAGVMGVVSEEDMLEVDGNQGVVRILEPMS
ncbi:MAG: pyruvate, phosphate dikinase [Gammaproteobacteria bacterium]|nr:pyruvate, phosphate dikinase [Gammaproteobacteria bacterium]